MHDTTPYVYVFVRTDLSHPQIVVQASHACLEMASAHGMPYHPHLVCIGIKSEAKLRSVLNEITAQGIRASPFIEPDIGDQMTAFATEPVFGERRKVFKRFSLLR